MAIDPVAYNLILRWIISIGLGFLCHVVIHVRRIKLFTRYSEHHGQIASCIKRGDGLDIVFGTIGGVSTGFLVAALITLFVERGGFAISFVLFFIGGYEAVCGYINTYSDNPFQLASTQLFCVVTFVAALAIMGISVTLSFALGSVAGQFIGRTSERWLQGRNPSTIEGVILSLWIILSILLYVHEPSLSLS